MPPIPDMAGGASSVAGWGGPNVSFWDIPSMKLASEAQLCRLAGAGGYPRKFQQSFSRTAFSFRSATGGLGPEERGVSISAVAVWRLSL